MPTAADKEPAMMDDDIRPLLDDNGLLRAGEFERLTEMLTASTTPLRFYVFSQNGDARFLPSMLDDHATRFFGGKIGFAIPKKYQGNMPTKDVARLVVLPMDRPAVTLTVLARPKSDADRRRAEDAAFAMNGGNMDAVAARCPTVYEVFAAETDEVAALLLGAVLSSSLLGPIVDAREPAIFAVRTARERLEGAMAGQAYRGTNS